MSSLIVDKKAAGQLGSIQPLPRPRHSLLTRVDFTTLKLFIAVAEERSMAKAAERENIATSAVSKRISDLEHAVGAALVKRHHKGLELTPAGRSLLIHARTILRDMAQLESEVFDYSTGVRGHIRVFANDSTIFGYLPEELSEFLRSYPGVRVEFESKVSCDILTAVAENEADIGIFSENSPTHGLTVYPYHRDRLMVVVARDHPLAERERVRFADLFDYDFIDQQRNSSIEMILLRAAASLGRTLKGPIRVSAFDATCRMVEAGLGVGILPDHFVMRMSGMAVRALHLDEPWAEREHKLCVLDPEGLPHAARLLLQHLIRCADAPSQAAEPMSSMENSAVRRAG
jgi:DNA-binding transcriptional LysR family regulator